MQKGIYNMEKKLSQDIDRGLVFETFWKFMLQAWLAESGEILKALRIIIS